MAELPSPDSALNRISVVTAELESIAVVGTEPLLESEEHTAFNRQALAALQSAISTRLNIINYPEANAALERMDEAVLVVAMGVPTDAPEVYGEDLAVRRREDYAFIDKTMTDIFGICLVHQIIAARSDVEIKKDGRTESGLVVARAWLPDQPVFENLDDEFEVYSDHWMAPQATPKGYTLAASTLAGVHSQGGCEQAVFVGDDGRVVSTQFHPENNANGLQMIKNKHTEAMAHRQRRFGGLALAA